MTVQGKSRETTEAIHMSQCYLGVETSNDWLPEFTPKFADFPFTDPEATFEQHLAVVKELEPKLAVAPDIEKGRTLQDVTEKADSLLRFSSDVVVVPKTVHPSAVPSRFRVGVPLADFGSGSPWGVWDYQNCSELHLLGGGPHRQIEVGKHLSGIESVDTATLGKYARFGYWDGKDRDAPDGWDYKRRLRESLDNYAEYWDEQ